MSNRTIMKTSIVLIMFFLLVAIFAPMLCPYDPNVQSGEPFESPSSAHLLGTNDVGQDILSEVIMGTRYSLMIGFFVGVISTFVAALLGIIAGYFGGMTDMVIMRTADFFMTIPYLPTVILLSAILPSGLISIITVLSVLSWPATTRVIRSQVIKIRKKDYILNIKAMGAKDSYILSKHILREVSPMVAYRFADRYKTAILAESTLSFLGLGSPTIKSWGTILYYAQQRNAFTIGAWGWWIIPPGLLISIFAFALMLFSYSFEENMDRRLKGMR